uniref:Uncharacterized protein n=1 Tax=Aegilops tauschii subsp. strangulata TaxID=200361 RepID=A0A453IQY9_AEGTS
ELFVVLDGDGNGRGAAVRDGGGGDRPHLHERVRLHQLHDGLGGRRLPRSRRGVRSVQLIWIEG